MGDECNCVCLVFALLFGVPCAMVIAGVQYDDPSRCEIDIVPQFLQVSGGIMLGFCALYLVCFMICSDADSSWQLAFVMCVNNACNNKVT